MNKVRCPQCGAQLDGDATCAERLYRILTSGRIRQADIGAAFAQFALAHPLTYSSEALRVAQDLLTPQRHSEITMNESYDKPPVRTGSWWRHIARHTTCH